MWKFSEQKDRRTTLILGIFLLLPALIFASGCKDMKLDIQDSKDRLDVLEGTTITTINEQITAINSSITDLQDMDKTLDDLKAADTALDKKIADLRTYVDTKLAFWGCEIDTLTPEQQKYLFGE